MGNFELLATGIETIWGDNVSVYEKHGVLDGVFYLDFYAIDEDTKEEKTYKSSVNPEELTTEQRHTVLDYCLETYHEDEIVNYLDLFLHGGYLIEMNTNKL